MANERKEEKYEAADVLNIEAKVTITRAYKLPLAKLTVSGTINQSDEMSNNANKIAQRAIVFVIDRSYSMHGERMTMVKNALKSFIPEMCNDENTIIKLILFNSSSNTVEIPRSRQTAIDTIEKRVYASGGTNFHAASQQLVKEAGLVLKQYPSYEV